MNAATCFISLEQVSTLKQISHEIRQGLVSRGVLVPGKRRFLDLVARGLGYVSFSHLTMQARGNTSDQQLQSAIDVIVSSASGSITTEILSAIENPNRETPSNIREAIRLAIREAEILRHHLSIHKDRNFYVSNQYGVVRSIPGPINRQTLDYYQLKQLWCITVSVQGLSECFRFYVSDNETVDLAELLLREWTYCNERLFGFPDELVVESELLAHLPGLQNMCDEYDIRLRTAERSDRRHTAIVRNARDDFVLVNHHAWPILSVDQLNTNIVFFRLDQTADQRCLAHNLRSRLTKPDRAIRVSSFPEKIPVTPSALPLRITEKGKIPREITDGLYFQRDSMDDITHALSLNYLRTYSGENNLTVDSALAEFDLEFLACVMRSWPSTFTDFKQQKSLCSPFLPDPIYFFDAIYFQCICLFRYGAYLGIFHDAIYKVSTLEDLSTLIWYATSEGEQYVLVDIGDSANDSGMAYLLLTSSATQFADCDLIFQLERKHVDPWLAVIDTPVSVKIDNRNFMDSEVIGRIDSLLDRCSRKPFELFYETSKLFHDDGMRKFIQRIKEDILP